MNRKMNMIKDVFVCLSNIVIFFFIKMDRMFIFV